MRSSTKLLGVAALALFASGCEHVAPWERQLLAKPGMAWENDALAAAQEHHTHFSKEAAMPGAGAGGGGCGCN